MPKLRRLAPPAKVDALTPDAVAVEVPLVAPAAVTSTDVGSVLKVVAVEVGPGPKVKGSSVGLEAGGPPEAVVKAADLVGACGTSVEAVVVKSQLVVTGGPRMMPPSDSVEMGTRDEVTEGLDGDDVVVEVLSELPLAAKTEN